MLLAQEPTAQSILPIGLQLATNAYSLMNELNIVLAILTVFIIKEFFNSRSQGQDEGAASVIALKQVEKAVYSVLVCAYLFFVPTTNQHNVQVSAYKCQMNQNTVTPVSIANRSTGELPIGWAVLNQVSVGISETLSSQLPCENALDSIKSKLSTALIDIDDDNLVSHIQSHYQQCFLPAQNRIAEAKAQGTLTLTEPYDIKKNYFFGMNNLSAYEGMLSTNGFDSKLRMNVSQEYWHYTVKPDFYTSESVNGHNVLSIPCLNATTELITHMSDYVEANNSEDITRLYSINQSFPQPETRTYRSRTQARQAFVHQAYLDNATGKAQVLNPDYELNKTTSKSIMSFFSDAWDGATELFDTFSFAAAASYLGLRGEEEQASRTSSAIEVLSYFGSQTERVIQVSKVESIHKYFPILLTVMIAIIYAAMPLLIVLSGFSWKLIKAMVILIFTMSFSFYILNLAITFDSAITSMADSGFGWFASNLSVNGAALNLVGSYTLVMAMFVWGSLAVIVGLRLGPLLTGLLNISGAAGEAGAKGAISAAKQAVLRKG